VLIIEVIYMDFSQELEIAMEDLTEQDPLFQPTTFWRGASAEIAASLLAQGGCNSPF
jgi:hypothetical protein